jgi:hypothetical protein
MLKLLGIVALVVLILVGALMPLKYTARMKLPKLPTATTDGEAAGAGEAAAGDDPAQVKRGPH